MICSLRDVPPLRATAMAARRRGVDPALSLKRSIAGRRGAAARWGTGTANLGNYQGQHHPDGDGKRRGYRMANAATGGRTVIDVFGDIAWWDVDAALFVNDLRHIDAEIIEVHISSGGGDVFDGLAMYQALIDHPATIEVQVDSLAASIASVIAQAGDKVLIAPNAEMMIHDAWCACMGNAAELRDTADLLDRMSDNVASIYAERSGEGTVKSWRKLMTAVMDGTWFSASEAVEAGLADEVLANGRRGESPEDRWAASMVPRMIDAMRARLAAFPPVDRTPPAPSSKDGKGAPTPEPPADPAPADPAPDPVDEPPTTPDPAAPVVFELAEYDPAAIATAIAAAAENAPAAPTREPTSPAGAEPRGARLTADPDPDGTPLELVYDADAIAAAIAEAVNNSPGPGKAAPDPIETVPTHDELMLDLATALQEALQ